VVRGADARAFFAGAAAAPPVLPTTRIISRTTATTSTADTPSLDKRLTSCLLGLLTGQHSLSSRPPFIQAALDADLAARRGPAEADRGTQLAILRHLAKRA